MNGVFIKGVLSGRLFFHGERGAQWHGTVLTLIPDRYFFQLHGMTENITLFNDGLTKATQESSQPPINPQYLNYIENGWEPNALKGTQNAIDYVSEFVPSFRTAQTGDNALYGGQQVPVMISPCASRICRCLPNCVNAVAENVKANSTLDVADKVMDALVDANLIEKSACKRPNWHKIDVNEVNIVARYCQSPTLPRYRWQSQSAVYWFDDLMNGLANWQIV